MRNSIIKSLDQAKAKEGFDLSLLNEERHIQCAENLAKTREFGIANSHLILGAEEAVKAMILFAIGSDLYPENDYFGEFADRFFRDHKTKHATAFMTVFPVILFESLMAIITSAVKETNILSATDEVKKEFVVRTMKSFYESGFSQSDSFYKEANWWKDANRKKNVGFYVDFVNKKWQTPVSITQQEYHESNEFVKRLLSVIKYLQSLSGEEISQISKEFQTVKESSTTRKFDQ